MVACFFSHTLDAYCTVFNSPSGHDFMILKLIFISLGIDGARAVNCMRASFMIWIS